MIAPFDVVATAVNVELAGDIIVDDSVVTVIDGFDRIPRPLLDVDEFEMNDFPPLIKLADDIPPMFDDKFTALLFVFVLLLRRDDRLDARADIRRFISSRSSDFNGETFIEIETFSN